MRVIIESYKKNQEDYYKQQFNEAFDYLRDEMIDNGLYTEAENKALNWVKDKLNKLCPSPDKLKEFVQKWGEKIDAKMKSFKNQPVKDAWNTLKNLANISDSTEPIKSGNGGEEGEQNQQQPGNGQAEQGQSNSDQGSTENGGEQQGNEEQQNESFYYDEGFVDKVKAGWNAFKNAGNGQDQKKVQQKKQTTKKTTNKGGKSNVKQSNGKNDSTVGSKVMEFLKKNWKLIVIILSLVIAITTGQYWLQSLVTLALRGGTAVKAAQQITTQGQELQGQVG